MEVPATQRVCVELCQLCGRFRFLEAADADERMNLVGETCSLAILLSRSIIPPAEEKRAAGAETVLGEKDDAPR